jgi:hypothetical protein
MPNMDKHRGVVAAGAISFTQGGGKILGVASGTVAVDPANATAGTKVTTSVTIAGVTASDIVYLEPPSALEAGLVYLGCRAKTDGVDLDLYNPTAGAVNGASRTWTYKIIRLA